MKATACLVVVVSGPGALERRSRNIREMMMANAVAHQADAITIRPRPFHAVTDQLARHPDDERAAFRASHTVPLENQRAYDRTIVSWLDRH